MSLVSDLDPAVPVGGGLGAVLFRSVVVLALIPMVLLCIWIWFGLSRPSPVLVLEGFQMFLLAPAWLLLVVTLSTRHWLLAVVAAGVAVSHLCFCLPAATADRVPAWVADAPTLSVYVANVRYDNPDKGAVAREVLEVDAEVVILNEMTPDQRQALTDAGVFDRYPTEVSWGGRPFGEMLLARVPVSDARVEFLGGTRLPAVTVTVGAQPVRIFGVHVNAPKSSANRHVWRRNLDGIGGAQEAATAPQLFAGDFNSAPWHGPFRDLLARGLTDAHDAVGQGLSRSWTADLPVVSAIGPIMRLDHALFSDGTFPVRVEDLDVPGSDHRGFELTLAVRQPHDERR